MIPKFMHDFLHNALPEQTWRNKLHQDKSMFFFEFDSLDIDRLHRLGISVDRLGPRKVICMWDEESSLEIGGYLVVDNLAMGRPSMGGIRMLPDVTPKTIFNLARGMTLKNAAADLPYGGGKAGIVAPDNLNPEQHTKIVEGFARLLYRYHDIYLPGPDVGTNDEDMKTIAIENGLDYALSKPVDMGGNRIDQLGAAAEGTVIALNALLKEMHRLKVIPQFTDLQIPRSSEISVLIQGFGAVGAHVARILKDTYPEETPKIVGISDGFGYLYDQSGLPILELFETRDERGIVSLPYFLKHIHDGQLPQATTKYSNVPNDLLRESAFCFIPAAPIARYLDVEASKNPSMTVDQMGKWTMIVESANTYSPDPEIKAARVRMERAVYWQSGVLIATDFLVNSGGVIYAAQERNIRTPNNLLVPASIKGDRKEVENWLANHHDEFSALAEKRRQAGQLKVKEIISRNMKELIDLLVSDPDMLPCEAAEKISTNRMTSKERFRTVADVISPLPIIDECQSMQAAAQMLIEKKCDILAVVNKSKALVGIVTDWDVTRASATACAEDLSLADMMTSSVITAQISDSVLTVIRKLEHYEISAIPVVDKNQRVLGVVSSDTLTRRSLFRILQTQKD